MQKISVIIVCKNEAAIIGKTLQALEGLTDDIIIYDNGSTDETLSIAAQHQAIIHKGVWEGYGKTRQKSIAFAKYKWVLSLDADEIIDEELKKSLVSTTLDENKVYAFHRKNFLNGKHLKYGEWGTDIQKRLFNREKINWDDAEVHESLVIPATTAVEKLPGAILHPSMKNMNDYAAKMVKYAQLGATKYFRKGKRSNWVLIRMAPGFTFLKYYILKGGFLDGYYGYTCARMASYYTFMKYTMLRELEQKNIQQ